MRSADTPREKERPRAVASVDHRGADEDTRIVVRAQIEVIVSVGDIDARRRPNSRAIDQPTVGADQSDGIGLRKSFQSAGEKPVDFFAARHLGELFGGLNPKVKGRRPYLFEHQIDRLERARRLLGENNAEIGCLPSGLRERFFASVPDRDARSK